MSRKPSAGSWSTSQAQGQGWNKGRLACAAAPQQPGIPAGRQHRSFAVVKLSASSSTRASPSRPQARQQKRLNGSNLADHAARRAAEVAHDVRQRTQRLDETVLDDELEQRLSELSVAVADRRIRPLTIVILLPTAPW